MAKTKNIIFQKDGQPLKVNFVFKGIIGASYAFTLWGAKTNDVIMEKKGNNLNDDDDHYDLPLPVDANTGRLIELSTLLKGLDEKGKYKITIEVYQGDQLIGSEEESGSIEPGETKQSFIYARLATLNLA